MDFIAIQEQAQENLDALRGFLDSIPQLAFLNQAEEAAKIPKEYLVAGLIVIFNLILFMILGAGSLCSVVGFGFPAYRSFHAIETREKEDDKQWLIYWVIYALFHVCETFVDVILHWIPFYFAFKLFFLLWAMAPQTKGAQLLYDSFVKDYLKSHEDQFDEALDSAKKNAGAATKEALNAAAEIGEDIAEEIVHEVVRRTSVVGSVKRSSVASRKSSVASVASRKSSIASEKAEEETTEEAAPAEEEEEAAVEEPAVEEPAVEEPAADEEEKPAEEEEKPVE